MKKKVPLWLNKIEEEYLEVLQKYEGDLGGPLNIRRFGKGSNLERLGTIYKFISKEEKASIFFKEASFAYWPYNNAKPTGGWQEDGLEYSKDLDGGYRQVKAAICAFLSGDKEHSVRLFTWARENIEVPKYALDFWRPGGEGESIRSGEVLLRQAYIESRIGKFNTVIDKALEAKKIFAYYGRKYNKKIDMEYRYQCQILIELAEYKLNPTLENKAKAQNALAAYKKACHKNIQGLMNYFYIFDLQEAFPEVFEPVLP